MVLLATYLVSMIFMLRTHRQLYSTGASTTPPPRGSVKRSILVLVATTIAVGIVSEVLVGAIGETARAFGLTQLFVGVVVIAIVGNAAEHFSAIQMAASNQMDAAIGIAVGSSTQIALFVGPALLLLSYVIGPAPMDLLFTTFELLAIAIAVLSIAFIAHDGETNWLEGVQLLAVYVILALGCYFLPETSAIHGR
jgi:Ca2+:H+ antiporter